MICADETVSRETIALANEIATRYQLASVRPLIETVTALASEEELSVAIVGRFKAGKSSFLNHLLGRDLLPIGVVPVTTVVTEVCHGPTEKAFVHFLSGVAEQISIDKIHQFIAESDNPDNRRAVATVTVELPALARFSSLKFVDLPGLESALAHNTAAVLRWLPNVGLALVTISVDPPLSQNDIDLLKSVYRFTPHVAILLTKIDLLSRNELNEVLTYVSEQLARNFSSPPPVFPFSVRSGYERFQREVEGILIHGTLADFHRHHEAILRRKLETLLRECKDYLRLALKSSEAIESQRKELKLLALAEKESLAQEKSELRLLVQHAAENARAEIVKRLRGHQGELEGELASQLRTAFPDWDRSLRCALECFEDWLGKSLTAELTEVSTLEKTEMIAPLEKLNQRMVRRLQNFRDRLSDRTRKAFSIPLDTTESQISIAEPSAPDIRIGKVFDRNWELLSPVAPMSLLQQFVLRHFLTKLPYMIEKNLSRLATQWDETIRSAMIAILNEAQRRLDELIETVERLIATSDDDAPRIRADLESIHNALNSMSHE